MFCSALSRRTFACVMELRYTDRMGVKCPAVKLVDNWRHGRAPQQCGLTRELQYGYRVGRQMEGHSVMTERVGAYVQYIMHAFFYLFMSV